VWPVDALARYLWECGLDVYTDPEEPPGHLVVREGDYTRVFSPEEVVALANALLAMGYMDEKGRTLREARGGEEALEALWEAA
jgi:predicted DNA-binding transcriptional regulator YafY